MLKLREKPKPHNGPYEKNGCGKNEEDGGRRKATGDISDNRKLAMIERLIKLAL